MLYADAHCHSNPVKGLGAEKIAKKFRRHNGWFIALVALPPYHYGLTGGSIEDYEKVLEIMVLEKKRVIENDLKAKLFAGFHPAEVDEYFRRGISLEKIIKLAEEVLRLIIKYYEKGLVDGIGEVGRQHYSTSPPRYVTSELIMLKALTLARDYDIPIHLHLEQGGYTTVSSIELFISSLDIPRDKVLFHHVDRDTGIWCEKKRFWHTIPAKPKDLEHGLTSGRARVLVESDFIDDPRRPGVSSYPWDIALNIEKLINKGVVSEEYIYRVMVDHVVKFYGVEPP